MKIAIAYLRVSTREQNTDNQRLFLEEWAKLNNYAIIRFYDDPGVSGMVAAFERPSFKALMHYLRNNQVDAVLVYELSRLGRSFWDSLEVIRQVDSYAPLIACSPKEKFLQTVDPNMRELLLAIFTWVAEREREVLIERIKAGMARRRAEGKRLGRPRKYVDKDRLRQLLDTPMHVAEIAKTLGIATPTLYANIRLLVKESHKP